MKNLFIIFYSFLFLFGLQANGAEPQLKEFSTDNCSMFPEGTFDNQTLWKKCCLEHDVMYWMGGTKIDKKIADLQLRACVEREGEAFIGWLMENGVRFGGQPLLNAPWKWGYGWEGREAFKELTSTEKKEVMLRMEMSPEIGQSMREVVKRLRLLDLD